ncbi:hypothetical protein [Micromonospora sp. WMMD708]|uniref:hypothetical protein n=1 Tax=Micromonospora sp. WMMD708 TaxID=3403464 RepID=UPI003BF4EF5D
MVELTVTFHAALLLGSDDTFGDRPDVIFDQEGSVDGWSYRVTVGAISARVREHVTSTPALFDALLSGVFATGPRPWVNAQDPFAARDQLIADAAANHALAAPWDDNERAFTSIEVWRSVEVDLDPLRSAYRYCWYDLNSAERVLSDHYSGGVEVAQFLLGALLAEMGGDLLFHRWKGSLRWLEYDRDRPCAVPTFGMGAVAVVRRSDSTSLVERMQGLLLPSSVSRDIRDKLATVGRWHSLAAAEEDSFRRFLWQFAGIEVISKAIAKAGRPDLLRALSIVGAPGDQESPVHELIWPSRDDGRDPDRNLVFSFCAMVIVLAPHRAAQDVASFRKIVRYRNQIHGGVLDPNDPPSRGISALWEYYSPLAAQFLSVRAR